jgi:hypothetical protein
MDVSAVVTSAGVGAGVGALVSGLLTVIAQAVERRARRRELIMKTASDLAMKHFEQAISLTKAGTQPAGVWPLGTLTYDYYLQLTSLMKDGKLPPDMQKDYEVLLASEQARS